MSPVLLWFRQDLRLSDHPALLAAIEAGPVIPIYVLDDDTPGDWRTGGAQRWWLHHSLTALAAALQAKGSRLILRRGRSDQVIADLMAETGAREVHALRHYEPWWRKADAALGDRLRLHDGNHLVRLEDVRTGAGGQFRIYSSFWKGLQSFLPPGQPSPAPDAIPAPKTWPNSDKLADWHLLPTAPDWSAGFSEWRTGEAAAADKLHGLAEKIDAYETTRNLPAQEGTSRLSPHLHFGEVSPRAVWHAAADRPDSEKFHKELAWRDFTAGVITQLPDYAKKHGRPKYDAFPWRSPKDAAADWKAWRRGRTGYPIVDAGMRQLWTSGWMHNRVRMITSSFLVKHLLIDWRDGERYFWDCLVDADYGNNAVNWQWIAGTGIDANMFGKIMAPLTQSVKFGAADYIRRWVPELAHLDDDQIHDPDAAGVRPADYPAKIIEHREARERALAANRAL